MRPLLEQHFSAQLDKLEKYIHEVWWLSCSRDCATTENELANALYYVDKLEGEDPEMLYKSSIIAVVYLMGYDKLSKKMLLSDIVIDVDSEGRPWLSHYFSKQLNEIEKWLQTEGRLGFSISGETSDVALCHARYQISRESEGFGVEGVYDPAILAALCLLNYDKLLEEERLK